MSGFSSNAAVAEGDAQLNVSGAYFDASMTAGYANLAGVLNKYQAYPWTPCRDHAITTIGVEVTTGVASAQAKVAVYSTDATTGGPGALLFESAALDCSAAAFVGAAWAMTLRRGTQYWFKVKHSSTATLRAQTAANMRALGSVAGASTGQAATAIQGTETFATASSDPFGAVSTANLTNINAPIVRMLTA